MTETLYMFALYTFTDHSLEIPGTPFTLHGNRTPSDRYRYRVCMFSDQLQRARWLFTTAWDESPFKVFLACQYSLYRVTRMLRLQLTLGLLRLHGNNYLSSFSLSLTVFVLFAVFTTDLSDLTIF